MQKKSFFSLHSVRFKLVVSYSLLFILITVTGNLLVFVNVRDTINRNLEENLRSSTESITNLIETTARVSIRNHLRAVADKNKDIVTHLYQRYEKGELTEQAAKKLAVDILLSQRIGDTGYVYAADSKGALVVHPRPEYRNVNFAHRPFMQKQMELKEGYFEYDWKNPEDKEFRPKATYMTYFKPWDWIISASSYREEFSKLIHLDDFTERVKKLRFGETGHALILDEQGQALVHACVLDEQLLSSKNYYGKLFIKKILERKNGMETFFQNDDKTGELRTVKVFFKKIEEFGWTVASVSYMDEFEGPLVAIRSFIITTVIISLALIIVLSFSISANITGPLMSLSQLFRKAGKGDFAIRSDVQSKDEIGELAEYFNQFMDQLEEYEENLEKEKKEREQVEKQIMEVEERERFNIGQSLHDDLAPHMIGIEVLSKVLEKKLREKELPEADSMETIKNLVHDAIQKTRTIARGLCPVHLETNGLDFALTEMVNQARELHDIAIHFDSESEFSLNNQSDEVHSYYIIHEAVHNAIKHSNATRIDIRVVKQDERFKIVIEDNGKGYDTSSMADGMGLKIMKFRASKIGADIQFKSAPGEGTIVVIQI
jgi:signal transduction histidine kinase